MVFATGGAHRFVSCVVEARIRLGKGATRVIFSEFVEAMVGEGPQQTVVAWRSSIDYSVGVVPTDQAERQKFERLI